MQACIVSIQSASDFFWADATRCCCDGCTNAPGNSTRSRSSFRSAAGVGSGITAPEITDPTEAVTAAEVTDVPGELSRAAGGPAKEGSVATLLFSMLLVSMPGGTLAGPPSPTAVGGSIAGMTSIAEAVDTSEGSCGSDEFGTSKNCGDDADFVVSPTAVERST